MTWQVWQLQFSSYNLIKQIRETIRKIPFKILTIGTYDDEYLDLRLLDRNFFGYHLTNIKFISDLKK